MLELGGTVVAGVSASVVDVTPTAVLAALPAFVFLGVLDDLRGRSEETEESADGGTLFDEEGDDELAFGDEESGDDFGGDDFGGGGDAFDDFGGVDEGMESDLTVTDLEHRVDQLEEELSGLSSTVSTVKTENEQISESVDDIEENIRKLLDIYKMVTKGVNPFVDQQGSGDFGAAVDAGGGGLGLFDDDEPEEEEDLDDGVMDADAEEFFEDDFDGEEFDAEAGGELDVEDDDFDPEEFDDSEVTDNAGATEDPADEIDDEFVESDEQLDGEFEDIAEDKDEFEDVTEDEGERSEDSVNEASVEEGQEWDTEEDTSSDGEKRVDALLEEASQGVGAGAANGDAQSRPARGTHTDTSKPYLETLPAGFVEDLVVLEWIEFLVEESSPEQAYSALTYYERVDWLGEHAADQLRTFLEGHPDADANLTGVGGPSALSTEHHTESLRYVARLNGTAQRFDF